VFHVEPNVFAKSLAGKPAFSKNSFLFHQAVLPLFGVCMHPSPAPTPLKAPIAQPSPLIRSIVHKNMCLSLRQILDHVRYGLPLYVHPYSKEIQDIFVPLVKNKVQELKILAFVIDSGWDQLNQFFKSKHHQPVCIIGAELTDPPAGWGFIPLPGLSLDTLVGSCALAIHKILECYGLDHFTDIFDREKTTALRKILLNTGLKVFIDAVLQVTYFGGILGDEDKAQDALIRFRQLTPDGHQHPYAQHVPVDFFARVLQNSPRPHTFLKAALSYYVVKTQGHSLNKASQILSISRTTLQDHMRLAEHYGINKSLSHLEANPH